MKWKKLGKVFEQTKPGYTHSQSPAAVVYQDRVRIFFATRTLPFISWYKTSSNLEGSLVTPDERELSISRIAYVDFDHSFKTILAQSEPILRLGQPGAFDAHGTNPVSVYKQDDKLWMYYSGWERTVSVPFNTLIGMATSMDEGNTFVKPHGAWSGPVIAQWRDEPFVLGSPRIKRFNDLWYLFYIAGKEWIGDQCLYIIRGATSVDGLEWNRWGKELIAGPGDECQASPEVFFHNGKYHMLFSYRKFDRRDYVIGYASSDDLKTWTRDDSKAGIGLSTEGWDSESISYPNIFELNGKIHMLYQGNGIGKSGFGLAVLDYDPKKWLKEVEV